MASPSSPPPRDGGLPVGRGLTIPERELSFRFTGSGGPGGQHANTSNTKVDLRFDVDASETLDDHQRARLRARYGSEIRVVESSRRSQTRNRDEARRRLADLIERGLRTPRRRVPTRPGRGATERRLAAKRRRSERKQQRRRGGWD